MVSEPQLPPPRGLWIFQQGRIYACELSMQGGVARANRSPAIDVRFQEVLAADVGALASAMDADASDVLMRLGQHRRCFAGWHGDEIATYCWISFQDEVVGEMERVLDLRDGEGYIWNCATLPQYRRNGLYTALLGFILETLAAEGLQRIWIGADLENVPSHRAFDSAGFTPAAAFTFFRLWRFYGFLTSALPETPPSLLSAARRLFRLDRLPSLGPLSTGWRRL